MSSTILKLLLWPRHQCRKIQLDFLNLTPYKKINVVLKMAKLVFGLAGLEVLRDCTRNWRTPFVGLGSGQYALLTFYTAWYYWDDNKITSIQPFSIMAIVVPVGE